MAQGCRFSAHGFDECDQISVCWLRKGGGTASEEKIGMGKIFARAIAAMNMSRSVLTHLGRNVNRVAYLGNFLPAQSTSSPLATHRGASLSFVLHRHSVLES